MSDEQSIPQKKRRGFATMAPEKVSEIASAGGRAAHQSGRGHEWTKEEARAAGAKGGHQTANKRRAAKGLPPTSSASEREPDGGETA